MKTRTKIILLGVATCTLLYAQCSTDTYMGRCLKWQASDIMDHEKFSQHDFASSKVPFHFLTTPQPYFGFIEVTEKGQIKKPLQKVIKNIGTTAFLFICNDSLLYKTYDNGYDRASTNTSFSTAKSITSLLIGKAIDEGHIKSEDDKVTTYFPELRQIDPQYDQLQIAHLLDMQSGIQFKDHDLPWGDKPKA